MAHRYAENREQSGKRAEEDRAAGQGYRDEAAGQRRQRGHEGQGRKAPTLEAGLQQEIHADGGGKRGNQAPPVGRLPVGVVADDRRMILEGELEGSEPFLDVPDYRAKVAPLDVGADIDAPGHAFPLDNLGRGDDADIGDVGNPDMPAVGRIDKKVLDIRHAAAELRRTEHHDLYDLLFLEE